MASFVETDINSNVVPQENALGSLFVKVHARAAAAHKNISQIGMEGYIHIFRTEGRFGVTHGAENTAPVCVCTEHGCLYQRRTHYRFRQTFGGLFASGFSDSTGYETGSALAVARDGFGEMFADSMESLTKKLVAVVLPFDKRIARHAVAKDRTHIIGGGIAVYGNTIKGAGNNIMKRIT